MKKFDVNLDQFFENVRKHAIYGLFFQGAKIFTARRQFFSAGGGEGFDPPPSGEGEGSRPRPALVIPWPAPPDQPAFFWKEHPHTTSLFFLKEHPPTPRKATLDEGLTLHGASCVMAPPSFTVT